MKIGTQKRFTRGRSIRDWIERLYNRSYAKKQMKISFEEFWEKGSVHYEIPDSARKYVRHEAFRKDPVGNALKTETGKIQIFSEKLRKL